MKKPSIVTYYINLKELAKESDTVDNSGKSEVTNNATCFKGGN